MNENEIRITPDMIEDGDAPTKMRIFYDQESVTLLLHGDGSVTWTEHTRPKVPSW